MFHGDRQHDEWNKSEEQVNEITQGYGENEDAFRHRDLREDSRVVSNRIEGHDHCRAQVIPREESTKKEEGVVIYFDSEQRREYDRKYRHRDQRIEHRPHISQCRAFVFYSEVAQDRLFKELPVPVGLDDRFNERGEMPYHVGALKVEQMYSVCLVGTLR